MAKKKEATLDDVLGAVNGLTESITKLVESKSSVTNAETDAPPQGTGHAPNIEMKQGFPVPYEYQELVNTLLNKHFQIEINYLPDAASFEFAILVPKNYSNAPESHWETYKEDRRSKVIQNAYGANGVREWVLQVYNNFNEETRSAITFDRAQL